MARRVALFVLSAAAAVVLAFVSQTGWVNELTARLLTIAAALSGLVAVVVLGVLTVRDHVLGRLSGVARWAGRGLVRIGERLARAGSSESDELSGSIKPTGALAVRPIKADSDEAKWKIAALTFLAWLYRRDEWSGLSWEGKNAEGAPEPYARKRLEHVGAEHLDYEVRKNIGPEPWWEPPKHVLKAAGGTRATCSCGWEGEGYKFTEHAGGTPSKTWRPAPATPSSGKPTNPASPPSLARVPEVGRGPFIQEMRHQYDSAMRQLEKRFKGMWSLTLAQANTRQEARRFDSEVKMAIGAANRYAQTYWDTGSVSVEAAEAAKSADPKAGPPWRDELSSRIEYVQAWMKAHPPPDSDRA